MQSLRIETVRRMLELHCKAAGGQAAFARQLGVTRAYINRVLRGDEPPSQTICRALGIREDGRRWVRI